MNDNIDNYFHVYNRGNSKQKIFHDDSDYKRFISLLYLCNGNKNFNYRDDILDKEKDPYDFEKGESVINIILYVLMPNHFHIFINTNQINSENISKFMKRLGIGYSKYYNEKYDRSGTLFEGKYKIYSVENDSYLKYLFSYIHLNPIKLIQSDWQSSGIKDIEKSKLYLKTYKHSSFLDWLNVERKESKIINKDVFLKIIPRSINLEKEVFEWLKTRHLMSG